jgi:hypothetical protein
MEWAAEVSVFDQLGLDAIITSIKCFANRAMIVCDHHHPYTHHEYDDSHYYCMRV